MIRTKSGLPRHCSWNLDRENGKPRVRFRKGGLSTYLRGTPWSPAFMAQYAAALDGVMEKAVTVGAKRTLPGSINALVVSYYRSPEFRGLKASTQTMRRNIIERFRVEHGDKPLKGLGRAHIKAMIGTKALTPEAANNLLKVLRTLLSYAADMEMLPTNPALGTKGYKSEGEGFHTWTESEVGQFQIRHPIDTRAGLALALLLYTGQRRGDVVKFGWQHLRGDVIIVRQEKTDAALEIPMLSELARALQATPRNKSDIPGDGVRQAFHTRRLWQLVS